MTTTSTKTATTPTPAAQKAGITTDITGDILTITTSDGDTLTTDVTELPKNIQLQLMLHGAKQKIVDAAAIPRDVITGASATLGEKFAAMSEVQQRLQDGEWNKTREAGAGGGANDGLLFRALLEYGSKNALEVRAYLDAKSKEQKKALTLMEPIAVIIARLRATAQATSGIDGAALLSELV